ncbi:SSX6, partial [Sigmodon hispidus]
YDSEDPTVAGVMKTDTSCTKNTSNDICQQKRMSKSFKDISKYFSEEEWAKLTKWQKSTYVYMKRNYIRMTDLGVIVNKPVFMRGKEHIGKGSDEDYVHGFPGYTKHYLSWKNIVMKPFLNKIKGEKNKNWLQYPDEHFQYSINNAKTKDLKYRKHHLS